MNWTYEAPAQGAPKSAAARKRQKRREQRGRKWDHLRTKEPVIIPNYLMREEQSPWSTFVQASKYGRVPGERAETVAQEKLDELMPGFNDTSSSRLADIAAARRSRRAAFHEQVWRILLDHPLVPAILRFSVLVLSLASLSLAANLWDLYAFSTPTLEADGKTIRTQWIVAMVIDCLVTPYVFYMTWDEYSGPQLGLRSPIRKVSLTLMDLFFIILKTSSTTLAFDSLWLRETPYGEMAKMKALASFILLGLLGWIMNFTVNMFRLIQRLGAGGGAADDRRFLSHA